jgi:CheY-like chemotaxis protein
VGRLAGGIAHDFNNLLTAILGYGELLMDRLRPEDPTHQTIAQIQKAAERAASLTGQLLSFSRRHLQQAGIVDMNATVTDTHTLLQRLIGEHIDLQLQLEEGLPALQADPAQLQQVLMNLVLNAADALPGGGSIRMETASFAPGSAPDGANLDLSTQRHLRLSVIDDGCGMDSPTLSRALEPFFTTHEEGVGTGLGLSTVYGIVKQSGGEIRIQSAPGQGTRVDIYLPAAAAAAVATGTGSRRQRPRRGDETILLVEDDDAVRTLSSTVLQTYGYTVLAARSGQEALAIAAARGAEIDLVLTDVVMPGMSGRELTRRLAEAHTSRSPTASPKRGSISSPPTRRSGKRISTRRSGCKASTSQA